MKSANKSISFVPSEIATEQLEELSRIAQKTPQAIVEDILTFELTSMFASADSSTGLDTSHCSLESYLNRRGHSREEATKIAAAYNVFVVRQARSIGRPAKYAAIAESDSFRPGLFRIYFPMLKSGVPKIARQAQQALKAVAA